VKNQQESGNIHIENLLPRFGLITLLINAWVHHYPEFVEQWYSRGLSAGMLNYEEVLMLVHAWRKSKALSF
jgi:hypothetical protein